MILKNYINMRYTFIALFIFALSALSTQQTFAQCPDDNTQYSSSAAPTVPGVTQTLTTCLYGGEYRLVTNMIAGQTYTFSTCGDTDFDTQITIYSNSGGAALAFNDDFCGLQSEVTFTPALTGDYRILIDKYNCVSESTCMTLNATLLPSVTNDDACNAEALTLGVTAIVNNNGATAEVGEVNPGPGTGPSSCDSQDGWCSFELDVDNSVWYTFVGPAGGCVNIDFTGTTDLQVAVYTVGSCGNFASYTEVAGNDDGGNGLAPALAFLTVVPGQTYYVQVDGYNGASTTNGGITVSSANCGPPVNDNACDATPLTIGVPAGIDNALATTQQWEPNPGAGSDGCSSTDGWCSFELTVNNSVWYTFVGPASGCVKIDVLGTSDLQMAVWTTPACGEFFKYQEVAANDDGEFGFAPSLDYFSVQPGQTYYVMIDGYNGAVANGDQILVTDGAGPVPAPWTTSHVGAAVGNFGYVSCGEEYTVSSNQYSSPFKDQGGYILQTLCGDGYIQARVNDIDGLGWAGIVMRESTAQGSKKVALKTQLGNLVRRDLRKSTNGLAQSQQYPRPGGWNWLRLERVGNQFAGYISEDGTNWQQLMAFSMPMNNCLQVGMFVESINVNAVTTAVFGNPSTGPCPCLSSFGAGGGSYAGPYCGASTGTPGFPADPTCEAAVCAYDPFCCSTSWDGICAGEAANDFPTECAACLSVGPPPPSPILGQESAITTPQTISDGVERIGSLTVYPNPSDGLVNIQVENFIGKAATVVIYNSLGQEVYTKSFDAIETSTITADLTSAKIASGLYNLNFVSEGQRITKQIVINK